MLNEEKFTWNMKSELRVELFPEIEKVSVSGFWVVTYNPKKRGFYLIVSRETFEKFV